MRPDTDSDVVRFVPESGKFGARLFHPPKNGRLSVCIADDRTDDELAEIGRAYLPSCLGWARTHLDAYREAGLVVERDDHPYPGHANVTGFPSDEEQLHLVKVRLRAESRFHRLANAGA